jgi:hypothetical protein
LGGIARRGREPYPTDPSSSFSKRPMKGAA